MPSLDDFGIGESFVFQHPGWGDIGVYEGEKIGAKHAISLIEFAAVTLGIGNRVVERESRTFYGLGWSEPGGFVYRDCFSPDDHLTKGMSIEDILELGMSNPDERPEVHMKIISTRAFTPGRV
jgi:hypothetical protein